MDSKTAHVAELNDELRRYLPRGIAVMTPGIAALEAIDRIVKAVAAFNNFCAVDPYQEREFGAFDADGQMIFVKIEYYDKTLTYHSPDPSNPSQQNPRWTRKLW